MRRQGSSCMLLPKSCNGDPKNDNTDAQKSRSVTIIHREDLPSYSCERFYLLSELQQRAHSSFFLSETINPNEDNSTQGTTLTEDESAASDTAIGGEDELAPFVLLYLFWKPDMTEDTNEFIEQHLLPQVQQLQRVRTVVSSMPSLERPHATIRGVHVQQQKKKRFSTTSEDQVKSDLVKIDHHSLAQEQDGKEENDDARTIRIYIVVDRLCACSNDKDSLLSDPIETTRQVEQQYRNEEAKIEDLARNVAIHDQLRDVCEGITVGLSNHERCAPGLEACADAVCLGAKERRTSLAKAAASSSEDDGRSALGIVTNEPNDLLGLQSESMTDAAQGVMQMRLSTEWNGQGNLKSFSERAQSFWRQQRGLVVDDVPNKMSFRRVISRKQPAKTMNAGGAEMNEILINGLALLLIFGYVLFHLRQDLVYCFDPSNWDNLIQRLRSF